jgi:GrpB-like predicted nucleotidyltransferase (UPF0157 family)
MPLGLEPGVVRLAEYDPQWPALFEVEAARITRAVSPLAITFHHVGSTAVPGLVAKPVLDMLATYEDPDLRWQYITGLTAARYVYRGEQGIPGRDFFRRGDPRSYHLHLVAADSGFCQEHLDFRDMLRADARLRDAYAALKQELAARFPDNRPAYIEAKGPFIQNALQRRHGEG